MTEKQIEIAAREFCRLSGLDPEEDIQHSWGSTDVMISSKRWELTVQKVNDFYNMQRAINLALTEG